jgi:hypothetical protein
MRSATSSFSEPICTAAVHPRTKNGRAPGFVTAYADDGAFHPMPCQMSTAVSAAATHGSARGRQRAMRIDATATTPTFVSSPVARTTGLASDNRPRSSSTRVDTASMRLRPLTATLDQEGTREWPLPLLIVKGAQPSVIGYPSGRGFVPLRAVLAPRVFEAARGRRSEAARGGSAALACGVDQPVRASSPSSVIVWTRCSSVPKTLAE